MKQNWEIKSLSEISEIVNGGTPDTAVKKFWDGEYLWITPKDMGKLESIYVDDTLRKITEAGLKNSSAKILPPYSIILSSRAPIGHLAINTKPITTNQGCKGLVPKKEVDSLFLYYFLLKSVDLLNSLGTGTTFKELSGSKLGSVEISLPPIAEQKRIVAILNKAFAAIDKAKANVEKNLQNVRDLFESQLKEVLEKMGEGWEVNTLGGLCKFSQGIQKDIKFQSEIQKKNQVRFLRIIDYTQGNEPPRYIDNPGDKYILKTDDVALVRYGASTGFVCRGLEGALANNLFRVISKSLSKLTNEYLYIFLQSPNFKNAIKATMNGTAMPAISFGLIDEIPFPLPSIKEQHRIISRFDELFAKKKKLEYNYKEKIKFLRELKKSLLEKAFKEELL